VAQHRRSNAGAINKRLAWRTAALIEYRASANRRKPGGIMSLAAASKRKRLWFAGLSAAQYQMDGGLAAALLLYGWQCQHGS
jgi:hypothetical protein